MDCDKCHRPAILYQRYSGLHLCARHFTEDFERKAKRSIRSHGWVRPGDRIGIALGGGFSSTALAYFLSSLLSKRRDVRLSVLTIDEGAGGCRNLAQCRRVAQSLKIPWIVTSYRERCESDLKDIMLRPGDHAVCTFCGTCRRHCLSELSREQGLTGIALGLHLDDVAGSVFVDVLRGSPGPWTGKVFECPGTRVMTPFGEIPEREVALYAHLTGVPRSGKTHPPCPFRRDPFRSGVMAQLHMYNYHHPASRFALVHLADGLRTDNGSPGGDSNIHRGRRSVRRSQCEVRDDDGGAA